MQAESSTHRQPQRSSKKTAAGVQRAEENVIAHEQKQADEVEVTNLVSDEDDDVDMKDELELRHEGMSKRKCEHVRGPHIGEPQRRQLGDDLAEYSKFDVSKQCKDCVDLHKTWASLDKQTSITVTVISQVLQWIGNMYHEFMQLIEGAKGAIPAARNTTLHPSHSYRDQTLVSLW